MPVASHIRINRPSGSLCASVRTKPSGKSPATHPCFFSHRVAETQRGLQTGSAQSSWTVRSIGIRLSRSGCKDCSINDTCRSNDARSDAASNDQPECWQVMSFPQGLTADCGLVRQKTMTSRRNFGELATKIARSPQSDVSLITKTVNMKWSQVPVRQQFSAPPPNLQNR